MASSLQIGAKLAGSFGLAVPPDPSSPSQNKSQRFIYTFNSRTSHIIFTVKLTMLYYVFIHRSEITSGAKVADLIKDSYWLRWASIKTPDP